MTRFIIYVSRKNYHAFPFFLFITILLFEGYFVLFENEPVPTYYICLGYLWLIISPYLIFYGFNTLEWFVNYIEPVMDKYDHNKVKNYFLNDMLSYNHMYFSIITCIAFLYFTNLYLSCVDLSTSRALFTTIMYAFSGFMAGVGFWGVFVMGKLIKSFCSYDLDLDPFCADGYGGILLVGRFLVIGSLLYFSGSLYIPFANNVIGLVSGENSKAIAYIVVFLYVVFGIFIYLRSIFKVHDKMVLLRRKLDDESQLVLDKLRNNNIEKEGASLADVLKPYVYYKIHHERIMTLRVFPYDTKSIVEIIATIMIPILIFYAQKFIN